MNTMRANCFLSYLRFNQKLYHALPNLVAAERPFSSVKPMILEEVVKNVTVFGKLFVNVPCDVEIKPTDPDAFPNMDIMFVRLLTNNKREAVQLDDEFLSVKINNDVCEVRFQENSRNTLPSDTKCLIESPVRYDIDVLAIENCNVHVSGMVSESIRVQTQSGDISGGNLQANRMVLSTRGGGSVKLRHTLQGNINIDATKDGSVRADKFLGTELNISTESGDVHIGSDYCAKSSFKTTNGNLNLNNLHMDCSIDVTGTGSVNITCLDGSLHATVKEGSTKVQVVRLSAESRIVSDGDIQLIVPEEGDVQLKLEGRELDIENDIIGIEENSRTTRRFRSLDGDIGLNARTSKNLRVGRASWIKTLNLGKFLH